MANILVRFRSIQYSSNKPEILYLANNAYNSNIFITQKINIDYVHKIMIVMANYGSCNDKLFGLYVKYFRCRNVDYKFGTSNVLMCNNHMNFENHEQLIQLTNTLEKHIIKELSCIIVQYSISCDVLYDKYPSFPMYCVAYLCPHPFDQPYYITLKLDRVCYQYTDFCCVFSSTFYPGIEFIINSMYTVYYGNMSDSMTLETRHSLGRFYIPDYNIGMYFNIKYNDIINITPTKKVMSDISRIVCYQ